MTTRAWPRKFESYSNRCINIKFSHFLLTIGWIQSCLSFANLIQLQVQRDHTEYFLHFKNIKSQNLTLCKVTNFIYKTYLNMQYKPNPSISNKFLGTRYSYPLGPMYHESNRIESKILANRIEYQIFLSESPSSTVMVPVTTTLTDW